MIPTAMILRAATSGAVTPAAGSPAARELLTRVFENPELAAEYPLVFGPLASGDTVELVEDGELRAACVILVREFCLGERRIRGGLIGSVATEPSRRGRGLGTRLLTMAEEALRARGCVFSLLWATDARFYLARGFSPLGVECDYLLVPELAPSLPEPSGVRELRPSDAPFLHRLYQRHAARVERTPDETRALLGVPGMLTLVRERAATAAHPAQPVAYACLGRGHDLPDVVHEWGGESEDVLALLRALLERRFRGGETGALFLMAPTCASEVGYRLLRLGAVSKRGILGLGKLLDLDGAAELLSSVLGSQSSVWRSGEALAVRGPRGCVELDLDTLQALLFGGPDVHDEVRGLIGRLGLERAKLPLEPFAFGLDSI